MGRPSFIATNLAADAVITMSNEDSVYPAENCVNGDYTHPTLWTADGSNWIEFDLRESVPVGALFWGNHNHPQSGFSMSVKAGNSPAPSSVVASPSWNEKQIIANWTEANYRYIRVEFSDTQPADSFPRVAEVWPGSRSVLPRGIRFGEAPWILQDGINNRTNRGKRYGLQNYELEQRTVSFRFPETELATFRAWWKAVGGMLYSFVWSFVDGGSDSLLVAIEDEGFKPKELEEQASVPVLDYRVMLTEEGLGAEIKR